MPVRAGKVPKYSPAKQIDVQWDGFEGGWNNIFRPTELKENELAQADNLMLVGKGIPTGRWGSDLFFDTLSSGSIRLLEGYYVSGGAASNASLNRLLAVTDAGLMVRRSGASAITVTGASFASNSQMQAAQMDNKMYIAGDQTPMVRFDGDSLVTYIGLSSPTNVSLSVLSSASGTSEYGWRISAISKTGETLASDRKVLVNMPFDLSTTLIKVTWNAVSTASLVLQGYQIYRGTPGSERLLTGVGPTETEFLDYGNDTAKTVFPPFSDGTIGYKAKYLIRFEDRLVIAGIDGEPNRVYISGRYPFHDIFTAIDGGAYAEISPDDGDEITGLGVALNQTISSGGSTVPPSGILVFKKNAVYRITLGFVNLGNFLVLEPAVQPLTISNGCSSAKTIVAVENDIFYFGRKGLYSAGQEPAFLNQLRTNEVSARIRPYIQNLSEEDFRTANADFIDNKYILSFPSRKETIIYDRERAAFMGPWKTPFGITQWHKYYDEGGQERWLAGTDEADVKHFSASFSSDSGTTIKKILRTKRDGLGSWSIMKVLNYFYFLLRNVRGQVEVNILIEGRNGNTTTAKSFSLTSSLGSGGWGSDQWGTQPYGATKALVVLTGDELARYSNLFKYVRVVQVEIITTAQNSNFEFLSARFTAQPLGDSSLPSSRRV